MNELDNYMMEIALKYPRERISDKFTENDGGRFGAALFSSLH
jgi:hypothetical protein